MFVYLNDIVIYFKTKKEHNCHVQEVLQAMKDTNLQIHPGKSVFHVQEVTFLRFIISDKEIWMDSDKVKAILKWPRLELVKGVQSFLRFANFYQKFIEQYSKVASLLIRLTYKNIKFEWGPEANQAFEEPKKQFSEKPILIMFDFQKPIILETDASDGAIGAVIS